MKQALTAGPTGGTLQICGRTSSRVKQFKMSPIGCLETLLRNHQSALRNIPEERKSHVHHGASLKSRVASHLPEQTRNHTKHFYSLYLRILRDWMVWG
jgi:hypothetical protein